VPIPADVLVAAHLLPEEAAELAHEFKTIGLTAELREVSPRRSLGDVAWLVGVSVASAEDRADIAERVRCAVHGVALSGCLCSAALVKWPRSGL
jgi:hypothetical protein